LTEPTGNPRPGVRRVFKRLTVDVHFNPIVNRRVLVEWALDESFIEEGPYTFTLYWSESPTADIWVPICEVIDQPWAYDTNPRLPLGKGTDFFYRVVLEDGNGNLYQSQAVNGTSYWGRYDWTLAREIIRKEIMLMRKRTGVKGYLYKRRAFGDPCPCTEPVTGQINDPNCDSCYGTSYVGGYYEPFEYWVTINPSQHIRKLDAEAGLITENIETVRGLAYPSPESNDFWVNAATDQRYVVMSGITALALHRGIPLILQLRLQERSRSDAMYKLPLPCGGAHAVS